MIVFGVGPAGTGKTYLAMAMAITAFRNDEVGRIILTRPAIEAGENSVSCLATCRVKLTRICGRSTTRCIRSWEQRASRKTWKKA